VVPGESWTYQIEVYDNNFPDEKRWITIDSKTNRWEYQASSNPDEPLTLYWGSPENGNLLFLSAVTPRVGTHPCLFCAGDETQQAQALAQVFTLGSAEVAAEVDGAVTGVVDGKLVEGIEGARMPPMFTNGDNSMMMLVPVKSGVALTVRDGEGDLPMQVGVYGPGFNASLSDEVKSASRMDKLAVNADGSDIRFEPSTTSGPSIAMARVTKEGTQTVVKLKLPEGLPVTSVSMQVDPETGDAGIQARAEGDVPLQVEVTRSTEDGDDTFEAEIVAPAAGAVEIEVSEWEGEGAPMPVGVDEEGTGNFEETEVVPTGPVGVAPDAPTGLAGVVEGGDADVRVALSWTDVSSNEESFVVERDAGAGFESIATLAFNASGTTDPNVVAGRTYDYRVRAENRYGVSAWSEVVSVRIPGCAAGEQDKDGDGECAPDCSGVDCGAHGACDDASGAAVCVCQEGYAGASCESCASGWQDRDGDGVCAKDCASSGLNCGAHGACADASGAAVCVCQEGYAGASCETCSLGYQDNDGDGLCAMDCATSGVSCGDHGACADGSGAAMCVCETGYAGANCESCAAGYQDHDNDGLCAMDCATSGVSCGDHGACADGSGAAMCVCETGYAGANCETCAAGYQDHDNDGVCAPDCATSGVQCGAHGACADASGAAVCVCNTGYAGPNCETCAPGYQDNDNDGHCFVDCATSGIQCGSHGECSDGLGPARCVCDTGYVGTHCETCADGYQDNDGDGVCAPDCATSGVQCGAH
ncbi:MAG TPA: hypothetical protein PK095_22520, partial [Myxococcota bacterium]|nr:hypothetical protein [Myxococcota bacterium]